MPYTTYKLKKTIGNSNNMDLGDSLKTKKALVDLGHMKIPDFGLTTYPDQAMIDGVKSFQKEQGLKADGVMKTDGPTIKRMNRKLSEERLKFDSAAKAGKSRIAASSTVGGATARKTPKQRETRPTVQAPPPSLTDFLDPGITKRGVLAPIGVKDGKAELALPQIAVDMLKAIQAPADVYQGRKAPTPELARETVLNLNAGSALLGKGPVTRFLASRSARLYNTPDKTGPPFQGRLSQRSANGWQRTTHPRHRRTPPPKRKSGRGKSGSWSRQSPLVNASGV